MSVTEAADGSQRIVCRSNLRGALILHWGVVGGPEYKGGWRLPGKDAWPPGTYNYKDRALQTPFNRQGAEDPVLELELPAHESSDVLNFVIKDLDSEEWFDDNGHNFAVPLREGAESIMAILGQGTGSVSKSIDQAPSETLPEELCGIWAYVKWEAAGSPARPQTEADAEYQLGIKEMNALLKAGRDVNFLWSVARGNVSYAELRGEIEHAIGTLHLRGGPAVTPNDAASAVRTPPAPPKPQVANDTVNRNAFVLWYTNGKPMGADFGDQSRNELRVRVEELRKGALDSDLAEAIQQVSREVDEKWQRATAEHQREMEEAERQAAELEARRAEEAERAKRAAEEAERKAAEAVLLEEERLLGPIDQGIINNNAFLIWWSSGKPDGADFSGQSRAELLAKVRSGEGDPAAMAKEIRAEYKRIKAQIAEEKARAEQAERAHAEREEEARLREIERVRSERAAEEARVAKERAAREAEEKARAAEREAVEARRLEEEKLLGPVTQDDINKNAFLLWWNNGKPDGADFGAQSRAEILETLRAGKMSPGELAAKIRADRQKIADDLAAEEERQRVAAEERAAKAEAERVAAEKAAEAKRRSESEARRAKEEAEREARRKAEEAAAEVERLKAEAKRLEEEKLLGPVTQDDINKNAFLLWWNNGKPDGADFGDQSRAEILAKLQAGEVKPGAFAKAIRAEYKQIKDAIKAEEEAKAKEAKAREAKAKAKAKAEAAKAAKAEAERLAQAAAAKAEEEKLAAIREQEQKLLQDVPQEVINKNAFLLWWNNGKPDGADFGAQSRAEILAKLADGAKAKALVGSIVDEWTAVQKGIEEEEKKAEAKRKAAEEKERKRLEAIRLEEEKVLGAVTQDDINKNAFLLWWNNGKPDGADFGAQSRAEILEALRSGDAKPAALAKEIRAAHKKIKDEHEAAQAKQREAERKEREKRDAEARKEREARAAAAAEAQKEMMIAQRETVAKVEDVGAGMSLGQRNPFELINTAAPAELASDAIPKLTGMASKIPEPLRPLAEAMAADEACIWQRTYPMGDKSGVLVGVYKEQGVEDGPVSVEIWTDNANDIVLHWGVTQAGNRRGRWSVPVDRSWPAGTTVASEKAVETGLSTCEGAECSVCVGGLEVPLQRLQVEFEKEDMVSALQFVMRSGDGTRWWKDGHKDFSVPLPFAHAVEDSGALSGEMADDKVAAEIVEAENSSAWTLMHRFNKAAEIIEGVMSGSYGRSQEELASAMSRVYIWLRYSSTRQITWQRRYNTQPRILSAAQDRLTRTIMMAVGSLSGEAQQWARDCLGTVGRGGDGQKIRDEILNIMHRHKIKEVKGSWMEEWHQKLHNNTTPDDIPICEAYIAFCEQGGNMDAYWSTLSNAGLTRARLESFDRPIVCEPDFYPHCNDGLIKDMYNYLGILKAVHSGADLHTSVAATSGATSTHVKGLLGFLQSHLQSPQVLNVVEAGVEVRAEIRGNVVNNRELLYLDLAVMDAVRNAAERGAGAKNAVALVGPLLENLVLSWSDNEELCFCLKAWQELPESVSRGRGRPTESEALMAMAVVERIRRAIADVSDHVNRRIGPASHAMGKAFGCEAWAVDLFSEEVVRGGPAFAVSLVLGSVEPQLRKLAKLGSWQIISPADVKGYVEFAAGLHEVQETVFERPTVLVCERVTGEEEIPDGVVAVLTPDAPDVLSHVSVRARNLKTLFATCYESSPLEELRALEGKYVGILTTASGEVLWNEEKPAKGGAEEEDGAGSKSRKLNLKVTIPKWCGKWAVPSTSFRDGVVGAKSKNIAGLKGRLPDWVALPASVTVPFSSFEEALKDKANKPIAKQLVEAAKMAEKDPNTWLEECRSLAMQVEVPAKLKAELVKELDGAGMGGLLDTDEQWEEAQHALKQVWASKFNERAFVSCRKVGLDFMDVRMAVLVQQVVDAQYAFVLHTTNPSTDDENEIYAELVIGLGETLVSGMYPGRSLSFSARKDALDDVKILSYPSKSVGLFVERSLIFRSDSNGEDLEGYAGAGLYDSITTREQVERRVDYSGDRMGQDEAFRTEMLRKIIRVGYDIEKALGSAQDIEGVVDKDGNVTVVQTRPQM